MNRKDRGFTLIEMLIVFLIIGIILSISFIGVPSYQRISDKYKLIAETRMILHTMLMARQNAIIDGYERMIFVNSGTGKIYTRKLYDPSHPPDKVIKIQDGIRIVNNNFSTGLSLKPIGTVSRGGHITLESPLGSHMTIVVQIGTGRIYMKEGYMYD